MCNSPSVPENNSLAVKRLLSLRDTLQAIRKKEPKQEFEAEEDGEETSDEEEGDEHLRARARFHSYPNHEGDDYLNYSQW